MTNYVWSQISSGTPWQKGSPHDLLFKSKRQLKALKGLGTGPLSGDDKKLLGLTSPPKGAVLVACAKGCAGLIRSGRAAKPDGKKEAELLIDAASNADPQLGKRLKAAVGGKGLSEQKDHKIYLVARRALSRDDVENNSIPGHVFLGGIKPNGAREAWGFYPRQPWRFGILTETSKQAVGEIRDDEKRFKQALKGDPDYRLIEFEVDKRTYNRAMQSIQTYGDRNDYGLFTSSCVHAAFGVLNEVGVIKSFGTVFGALPEAIYDFIPGLKASMGQ